MIDYKQLSEVLYPDIARGIDFFFDKYQPRVLKEGAAVTRIAPSPTGYLHIGHLSVALADKLTAEKSGGAYFIRLEDTDSRREVENAGEIAYDMLKFYGVEPAEGYMGANAETGEYGPYIQSRRTEIYSTFAKHLVSLGKAYPCFCEKCENKEEIEELRQKQIEENEIKIKDPCRNLTLKEVESNIKDGKKFALRLRSAGDDKKTFKFKDLIKGEREVAENDKDIVLIKSNGTPVYAFAHAVDDTLMGTTIVIRGEEWYASLASHLELFRAFGFKPIKYAHMPVICKLDNGNKRKLSKRKDKEADVRYFITEGYPQEAIIEYLLTLLNSDFELWRAKNPSLPYTDFDFKLSKVGSNNPIFDLHKMEDISKTIISRFDANKVYDMTLNFAKDYDRDFYEILKSNKDYMIKLFGIDRGNEKPRKDIAKFSDVKNLYSYMIKEFYKPQALSEFDFDEKISKADIQQVLIEYKKVLEGSSFEEFLTGTEKNAVCDDKQTWFEKIKLLCGPLGFAAETKAYKENPQDYKGSIADVSGVIRVAITCRRNTIDLYEIIKLLGKNEVIKRLDGVIALIK